MTENRVIVVGAGISGLTAAALLAKEGIPVTLLEAHSQVGGCAGTFRRGPYVFDVGATQIAGIEPGGIHERIFRHLLTPLPSAQLLDPACVVDLIDGIAPICLWNDPQQWKEERQRQFPGSEPFWRLCQAIHQSNWSFSARDPIVPSQNMWDVYQLLKAIRPENLISGFFSTSSILDLLKLCGCEKDLRLRRFLDLQLRLYSQEPASRTAALYGATVLHMAQSPLGLWHLNGSMQALSNLLLEAINRFGGKILLRHRVSQLALDELTKSWKVLVQLTGGRELTMYSQDVICSLPPQCLVKLIPMGSGMPKDYLERLKQLPQPSGAIVFYGALNRRELPRNCPGHFQLGINDPGSLFISISRDSDGRAPSGQATVIASMFTPTADWSCLPEHIYRQKKGTFLKVIRSHLDDYFHLSEDSWLHQELATPSSFLRWTGRPDGIVGGLGQQPSYFGPFGLPSRTPMKGLWLCGDSIHPGEGTAGVSQSALMASRQLIAQRGCDLSLAL